MADLAVERGMVAVERMGADPTGHRSAEFRTEALECFRSGLTYFEEQGDPERAAKLREQIAGLTEIDSSSRHSTG